MAGLVIQEIYGGSGSQNNATSTYNADYVVLHNTSSVAVDLTGYAIQVREGGGGANTAAWGVAALSGSVAAYGYFLIKLTGAGTGGATLSFDQDVSSVMTNPTLGITGRDVGATNGRIALTNTTDSLVTSDASSSPAIVDYAGWGNAISFEGAAETGAAGSRILSMYRDAAGGWDTNNNQADFSLHTPVPSNASSGALNAPPSFTSSATANFAENGTGTVCSTPPPSIPKGQRRMVAG